MRDLLIDHSGRVWVATRHRGVFRCDNPDDPNPVFHSYTTREGLSSDTTSSLAEDLAGFIYAGTARGVDRIDPRAAPESRRIRHFTAADGLPESEQNTAFRDSLAAWFAAMTCCRFPICRPVSIPWWAALACLKQFRKRINRP